MKIVHIINYFQPQIGYQEYYLAKEQVAAGNEVHIITSDRYYPFKNFANSYKPLLGARVCGVGEITYEDIKIHRLPIFAEIRNFILIKQIKNKVISLKPDILIIHGIEQSVGLHVLVLFRKEDFPTTKIIFDSHWGSYYKNNEWRRKFFGYFWRVLFKRRYGLLSDKTIAVTDNCKQALHKYLHLNYKNINVVKLGVNLDLFKFSQKSRDEIRKKYDIQTDEIVGLYSGKLSSNKGLHELCKALTELFEENKNLKFIFIGFPEDQVLVEVIKQLPADRSFLVEPCRPQILSAYYSAADFGIWPASITASHYEAMGTCLPIIVSPLEAAKERVSYGNGYYLRDVSTDEIKEIITKLITDRGKMKSMGRKGSIYVEEEISWNAINKEFLK